MTGPSGSGKSTLMHIPVSLIARHRDSISRWSGTCRRCPRTSLREVRNNKIGFVFQGFNLLADERHRQRRVAAALLGSEDESRRAPEAGDGIARSCRTRQALRSPSEPARVVSSSASRLRARSSHDLRFCWRTNQQVISTPAPASKSWESSSDSTSSAASPCS